MKCLKCGADISEGYLYCEKCGEEIHIVPVFEPEVETEIDETMQRIQGEMEERTEPSQKPLKKRHHYFTMVIILVIISIIIGIYALTYLYQSPSYQINRGNRFADKEQYEKAIECYENALMHQASEPVEVYKYIVICYEELGYEGKYEEYLLKMIHSPQATETDLSIAYSKLITFYLNDKNYNKINSLLKSCNNDNIISLYKNYMVEAPSFSHESGFYMEIIPLKITSLNNETIYYTMDGTEPTQDSFEYKTPIFLENGTHVIRAACCNENGVMSDVVIGEYRIEF